LGIFNASIALYVFDAFVAMPFLPKKTKKNKETCRVKRNPL
jgi:hypothetical protein